MADGPSPGDPVFVEDFFERIVNVQWDIGLAVDFGDKATDAPKPDTQK